MRTAGPSTPCASSGETASRTRSPSSTDGPENAGTRALDLRELLGRFIDVCKAVQYAHDRGVLHRDLKPGNIMLGKYGETMVVDWGLAKPLGAAAPGGSARSTDEPALQPPSASGTANTLQGAAVGTPQYMSPEQAAGRLDQLGPASDIYSLGATLYALLTGRAPIADDTATDPRRPDVAALLRKVQQGEFPRPRQVKPDVNPALEAICLKAMALKPENRYATPSALIDDLKHWLAGEPVSAWPEPWTVRTRRWVDRHRTLVTGIAAAVLVGLVSLAASTVLLAQANDLIHSQNNDLVSANEAIKKEIALKEEQRQLAKGRLTQSLEALALFATDFRLFCEDALVPGESKARLYERLIGQLEQQVVDETGEAGDDAYRNRVWMYQTIAIVYLDTQQREKARVTIQKGLKDSEAWLKLKPGDPYALSFHAALLSLRGDVESSQNPAAAQATYQEVLKLRRQLAGNPGVDRFTPGRSLMQLADTLDKMHEYDESLKLREQVCNMQIEKGVDADRLFESMDFWCWTCWKAYVGTGNVAKRRAYLDKADELSRRIVATRPRPAHARPLDGDFPGTRRPRIQHGQAGRGEEGPCGGETACGRSREALPGPRRHFPAARRAPDLMFSRSNYGRSFYALGLMQKNLGKNDEARANFEKSRQVREELLRDFANHPNKDHLRIDLLFSLVALGEQARAVSDADKLQAAPFFAVSPGAQSILYRLACIYSLSAAAVEDARRPAALTAEDRKLQAAYKDKALTALEKSHALGNRDFFTTRNDADLISIRDDPRFQKVLELEKKQLK